MPIRVGRVLAVALIGTAILIGTTASRIAHRVRGLPGVVLVNNSSSPVEHVVIEYPWGRYDGTDVVVRPSERFSVLTTPFAEGEATVSYTHDGQEVVAPNVLYLYGGSSGVATLIIESPGVWRLE